MVKNLSSSNRITIKMLSDTIKACLLQIVSGDRTPKQKVKLKVTEEKLLKLMLKYNGGNAHAEVWQSSSL